ncbi:DUF418 domain-containing protein [Halobacterium noricense]|uniref:DUF418 domain-containing protein n=1 Tax=Halobacterium noricense TaxID=223182 RepID=UPI001E4E57C1|nr:DUF418 domain-containing protein [Halobacterium noricense]UHH25937.1 DUF418 domain-containing protein [Halobacterium noricense]
MSGDGGPTPPSERVVGLDALRGFALLGILVVNVRLFSMPEVVLLNPTAYGDFTGANYWAWFAGHVLVEQKFITLFTLLFGGGIALFTRNRERRGDPVLGLHLRRSGLLVAFGLLHAYLLWYGDVLVAYGVTALWVVSARHETARRQAVLGLGLLVVPSATQVLSVLFADLSAFAQTWQPAEAALRTEVETYRSGWLAQMAHRVPTAFERQTAGYLASTGWRVSGSMLLGMALFEWGVLTNDRSRRFYRRLAAAGGVTGLAVVLAGVWYVEASNWTPAAGLLWRQFNYWGSLPLAGAYVALVMLYAQRRPDGVLTRTLAGTGRTAFSNYLLQSLLATWIFYGHGLRLFGRVTRFEALGIVAAIWVVQAALSMLWLRQFRFGPMEWLWRTLTYGERQPLRIQQE